MFECCRAARTERLRAAPSRMLTLFVVGVVVVSCAFTRTTAASITDETGRLLLKSGWNASDCSCSSNNFDYTGMWKHDYAGRACVRQGG